MTEAMESAAILPKIRAIKAMSRHRLQITWDDNKISNFDMSDTISEGNAFSALRDQDLFATARIGERRRTIEWPDPLDPSRVLVDYCADSLREKAERQGVLQELQKLVRAFRNKLAHSAERVP
jgi:Protein of unknown function (DUF2442)